MAKCMRDALCLGNGEAWVGVEGGGWSCCRRPMLQGLLKEDHGLEILKLPEVTLIFVDAKDYRFQASARPFGQ